MLGVKSAFRTSLARYQVWRHDPTLCLLHWCRSNREHVAMTNWSAGKTRTADDTRRGLCVSSNSMNDPANRLRDVYGLKFLALRGVLYTGNGKPPLWKMWKVRHIWETKLDKGKRFKRAQIWDCNSQSEIRDYYFSKVPGCTSSGITRIFSIINKTKTWMWRDRMWIAETF